MNNQYIVKLSYYYYIQRNKNHALSIQRFESMSNTFAIEKQIFKIFKIFL